MSKRIEAPLTYSEIETISQFQVSCKKLQISGKKYLLQKIITKSDTLPFIKKEKTHILLTSIIFGRHVSLQNNVHFSQQKGKISKGFALKNNNRIGFEQF